MRMARSSAQAFDVFLIERVPRSATRASAPTWSTPGRPCRKARKAASERVTSLNGGRGAAMSRAVVRQRVGIEHVGHAGHSPCGVPAPETAHPSGVDDVPPPAHPHGTFGAESPVTRPRLRRRKSPVTCGFTPVGPARPARCGFSSRCSGEHVAQRLEIGLHLRPHVAVVRQQHPVQVAERAQRRQRDLVGVPHAGAAVHRLELVAPGGGVAPGHVPPLGERAERELAPPLGGHHLAAARPPGRPAGPVAPAEDGAEGAGRRAGQPAGRVALGTPLADPRHVAHHGIDGVRVGGHHEVDRAGRAPGPGGHGACDSMSRVSVAEAMSGGTVMPATCRRRG